MQHPKTCNAQFWDANIMLGSQITIVGDTTQVCTQLLVYN